MENILREILSKDKTILSRRDELIAALDEKITGDLSRSYAPIKRAINLNVGEIFLVGESDKIATQEKVREILKASGMQEARINFVVDTFSNALDWDDISVANFSEKVVDREEKVVEEVPSKSKISLKKESAPKSGSTINEISVSTKSSPATIQESTRTSNYDDKIENLSRELDELQSQLPPPKENFQPTPKVEDNFNQEIFATLPQNHKTSIFTTEGRLNRRAYFIQSLKVFGLAIVGWLTSPFLIGIPILIAALVGGYMVTIRRLHDLNKSGWWVLLFFIPYVDIVFSFYLLLMPGTNGINRYGFDPLTE